MRRLERLQFAQQCVVLRVRNHRRVEYVVPIIVFVDLATQLSPEWLTCDGELSRREVNRRYAKLQKQWHALERQAGRAVTEDEVWAWDDAQRVAHTTSPDAHLEEDYELRVSGGEVGE